MIQSFVDRFMAARPQFEERLRQGHPESYQALVRMVIETLTDAEQYDAIDPERIHEIDDGHYQGTLLYVIAAKGYQPSDYWYVKVSYGSCSGCDTLQAISGYSGEPPNAEQVKDYWTLALHIAQGLHKMDAEAR